MIRWLIQSVADNPDLTAGRPPVGLLTPAELEQFSGFLNPQRRRDWLLGRWTAKRLVQTHIAATDGFHSALDTFAIEQEPNGAPYVKEVSSSLGESGEPLPNPPQVGEGFSFPHFANGRMPIALSISHSHGYAFCALCAAGTTNTRLGVDIELVEARPENFVQEFFTAREQVNTGAGRLDLLTTVTWSGKEAVLKAAHLGLRIDPRRVQCLPRPGCPRHWTRLSVEARLAASLQQEEMGPLRAWWRVVENRLRPGKSFVLVIAAYGASL